MSILKVDEKWSIIYGPENNNCPTHWVRYKEKSSPFDENNATTAMFYALLEKQTDTRDAEVIAQLVEAAEAQLQYMDMCGDKGDLERNLRAALAAAKGLKNE